MRLQIAVAGLAAALSQSTTEVRFTDVTAAAGITFVHSNAGSSEKYLIETMGSGAAWIDVDGDGFLDIYLANSAPTKVWKPDKAPRGALYRNNGNGTFTDITDRAGVGAEGLFAMGVAVGDYNNDGRPDLYVVGYNRSILFRNDGGGRFTDVTAEAGVANAGKWGSSAAWIDYDHDGLLDLVIANYVDWSPENNIYCGEQRPGYRSYCHPNKFKGQTPTLYHNKGGGVFEDVTTRAGLGGRPANGLGVVTFDANGDGWTDIFIANDSMQNSLFLNKGNGTFEESAIAAGVGLGENGEMEAGMGVDAADYDGDGLPDLYITHLDFELNRLYRNGPDGIFEDRTEASGLGHQAFHLSGFGVRFVDYDNDGWRDLFLVNGHVMDNITLMHPKTTYAEPKLVFRNVGGRFHNVTAQLGPDLAAMRVSRAAAFADYDNDGDIDVLVSNNGQAPQLLRNDGGNRNHWIQVQLVGTKSNRDGYGAKVKVIAGRMNSVEERKGGMSYQSAHDPRLHFGLGTASRVDSIEVRWPSGIVNQLAGIPADQVVVVKEGSSEPGETAASHRDAGLAALRAGRIPDARMHFEAALRLDPNEAVAHDGLGVVLAGTGDLEGATSHFRAAVKSQPAFAEAHFHLGMALDRAGQQDQAIAEYREAVAHNRDFIQARYMLAGACQKKGDLDGAERLLRDLTSRLPDFAEAKLNLGLLLQAKQDPAGAVEQLRAAAALQPDNPRVLLALGVALAERQPDDEAVTVLRKAVQLAPTDPETHYNLAIALATKGSESDAEAEFREALRLKPDHEQAHRGLGVNLMHAGRLPEALDELRRAVEIDKTDAEALNNLGLVLLRMNKPADAAGAFERATQLRPNLIKAHNNLAQAYLRAGRREDSRRESEKAAELTAQERGLGRTMVLIQSARQRLARGENGEAIAELKEAVQITPSFADGHYYLGVALANGPEAVAAFRKVVELNPTRGDAHQQLAMLYEKAGQRAAAQDEYREAARLSPCSTAKNGSPGEFP